MSYTHVETAFVKPPRIFWPLLALGIILAADGATALIFHTTAQWASHSLSILYLLAPLAALLVGIPAWFRFIVTPRHATIGRGLLLGILGSIAAHPVMWILFLGLTLSRPMGVQEFSLPYLLVDTLFSLIYGGWATTFLGAFAGALLIYLQRALTRVQQQQVSPKMLASQRREMSSDECF